MNGLTGGFAYVISLLLVALPLVGIPFAFSIAGGLLGRVFEFAQGARKKAHESGMLTRQRERSQHHWEQSGVQSRQKMSTALLANASKDSNSALRKRVTRGVERFVVSGYNIEAEASAQQAAASKEVNDMIATGKDGQARGLTVDKKTARRRVDEKTGKVQWESLGGAWVDEADVDEGHRRWGHNIYAQQAALSYEMRKADTEEKVAGVAKNYKDLAHSWHMSESQAAGAWIGASFENQNQHLAFKGTDWETGELKKDDKTGLVGGAFVTEAYEKKGSYALSQMSSYTIEQLKKAHTSSVDVIAKSDIDMADATAKLNNAASTQQERQAATVTLNVAQNNKAAAIAQQQKVAAVAETFMSRYGAGGGMQMGEDGGAPIMNPAIQMQQQQAAQQAAAVAGLPQQRNGQQQAQPQQPLQLPPGMVQPPQLGGFVIPSGATSALTPQVPVQRMPTGNYSANSQGAGHVAERVVELAQLTGVYREVPRSADSTTPHAGNPNQN